MWLSGLELYSGWVPLTVDNYLAVMLWCVLHTSLAVFFYDYSSCQASLNLPLISLAYLLKGKRYTPGESPKFGIEIFHGISRKFRRVAGEAWHVICFSARFVDIRTRLSFLNASLLSNSFVENYWENTPWGTMNLIISDTLTPTHMASTLRMRTAIISPW